VYEVPGDYDLDAIDGDGDEPTPDVLAELQAVTDAEAATASAVEQALESTRRELEAQRRTAREAVARYRDAALAAEPDLPPDLVAGETLDEVDASLAAARRAVAQIRQRIAEHADPATRGFPAGAPARGGGSTEGMSAAEKIARGLEQRAR
jgi:hypothetical protein